MYKKFIMRITALLLTAIMLYTTLPLSFVCYATGADDLVGKWERFGDGAEGTVVVVENINNVYQAKLERVTGTLIDLGFQIGDLKWKDITCSSGTTYSGKDMFRYETGGYEYRNSSLIINSKGVLEMSVYDNNDAIIGTYQTWRKIGATQQTDTGSIKLNASAVNGQVQLEWQSTINASSLTGYNLYRGTYSAGEETTPITDFPVQGSSYTDPNVDAGKTYYYICKAVYSNNTESTSSNEVAISVSASVSSKNQIILQIGNSYMLVNGTQKEIDPGKGTNPQIVNGRTLVPIRAIIEELGGTVSWVGSESKVVIQLNSKTIELKIGNKLTRINNQEKATDVAPQIINSRTMIPLRYVIDNLGYDVIWDGTTKKITITY